MKMVSTIYVVNKDKQFLMTYNKKQGAWLPPGGFVEEDEHIHEAGIRETKEETGISIGSSLRFMGHVAFSNNEIDDRTSIVPTPLFVATQTLSNGKVVENFLYLAQADNETIDEAKYEAAWFIYEDIEKLGTFENVLLQIKYIYEHFDDFSFFPKESISRLQYHK